MSKHNFKEWQKVIINGDNIEFLDSDEEGGLGTVEYYKPKPKPARKRLCVKCRRELSHLENWMTYHSSCYKKK